MAAIPTPSPATVPPQRSGPPGFGNGGWVCGMLSERLDALAPATPERPATTIRLSAPTPAGEPLRWEVEGEAGDEDVTVRLLDGETVLGTARRAAAPELTVPAPVGLEEARAAAAACDLEGHPYPGCYTCGPDNDEGLHVYAAPVDGRPGVFAATVTLPDDGLPPVMAALDCPGAFAVGFGEETLLLGTFTAQLRAHVPRGRELVVMAWEEGRGGRKRHCGTALLDGDEVVAQAAATWIVVTRETIPGTAPGRA